MTSLRAGLARLGARARRSRGGRLASLALVALVVGWTAWRLFRLQVGSPDALLEDVSWTQGTRVVARDGRLLGERPSPMGLRGVVTSLADISPRLLQATIESEDRHFREHDGIDRGALLRAIGTDVRHLRVISGGSTITQQLVKRITTRGARHPRTVLTKLREMAAAQNLEARLDKDAIVEAYLNRLDYGRGLAGPEAAALGYFGVHARDLSLAQASFLAVLPRAPSALDPYRHRARGVLRQRALLVAMRDHRVISEDDFQRATSEPLVFKDEHAPRLLLAPHMVLARAKREQGKAQIRTSLDFDLQREVEGAVRSHASRIAQYGASNAAVVVVDNATGEVLAEVGSVAFGDERIAGSVDAVHARRQPGSTLKPFVYARAFETGVSPMQMLADVPTDFGEATGHGYAPDNFDGTFVGPVSAREALGGSLNVPAVRLAADLGATDVVRVLREAGLPLTGGAERFGLSIALGSGEVTPFELAEAYTTLARGGEHVALGESPLGRAPSVRRVLDPAAVASVADALADPMARIRGLRTRGPFEFPWPVAVKTGTSTGYRDAWTAGFTRERTVVVWVGNADGTRTQRLTGAVGAGPLFHDVMTRAMKDVASPAPLYDHALLDEAMVCPLSGLRATHACPDQVRRLFPHGHTPGVACTVHRMADTTPARTSGNGHRCNAEGSTRIAVFPDAFGRWLDDRPTGAPGADPRGIPWLLASRTEGCEGDTGAAPRIVVLEPHDGSVLQASRSAGSDADALDVRVETQGLPSAEPLEVVVDGRVARRFLPPYRTRVTIGRGDHLVEVRPENGKRAALVGRALVSVR